MKSLNGADLKSITRFLHTLPIFSVFGFKILGAAFAFALTVVIGRYLGAEDAGIYYTTISATLLLAFLGSFGLPQVVMREVAVGVHKKDPSFRHSIQRVLKIAAVATSFLSVVVLIGGADIAGSLFKQPSLALYLPWTVLALIGTVVFNLAAESLRGFQQIAYYSYLMFAGVNLVSAVILVSAYGGLGESGNFHPLDVSIFAYVVACVVNAGLALVFVRKVITRTDQGSISLGQVSSNAGLSVGQLVRSGSAFLGYGFATQGIQWIAPLVLAYFRTSDEVAIYSSALRISTLVGFLLVAVASALGPRFAAYYRNGQFGEFRSLYFKAQWATAVVALPLIFTIWMLRDWIMAAFGPDFKAGGSVLAILLVGELVSALVGPVAQILIAASKERTLQHLAWVNLAMNSVLYVWLCNLWGATGAAVATSAGVVFINFTVAVVGLGLLRRAN